MARKKKSKLVNYHGTVMWTQVPKIITFDENHVEYICEHLGDAIQRSYEIFDLFGNMGEDEDPFA